MNNKRSIALGVFLVASILACNLPGGIATTYPGATDVPVPGAAGLSGDTPTPEASPTSAIVHVLAPAAVDHSGKPIYDVESSVTAAEKRAPYGDSFDINRLERPFLADMTYVPDLDIETFSLSYDSDFFYVSMDLIGGDPNNPMGIQYGVELDTNADGFGDFIVLGKPPFSRDWSTTNVQVYQDSNHDTAGLSGDKSDAPIETNGYDSLIYDGGQQGNADPDLAWVRINFSDSENVQFSFKRSLVGSYFMFGVLADAGLRDVGKLDYVDRFKEQDAGSPVRDKEYYPLGALFAVDNTCREVFGFKPNGYEPMLCPRDQPQPTKKPTSPPGFIWIPLFLLPPPIP